MFARLREKAIPDLICHFHFLAAVGKNLFEQSYGLLRKVLKSSKVRTDLRTLLRDLRDYPATQSHDRRFDKDGRFSAALSGLEQGWQAFCELRDVLQLSNAELPRADVRAHQRKS